jgi:hypothetical protein
MQYLTMFAAFPAVSNFALLSRLSRSFHAASLLCLSSAVAQHALPWLTGFARMSSSYKGNGFTVT